MVYAAKQSTLAPLFFYNKCYIHSSARDKEALVADHMKLHNGSIHWELNFTWAGQEWELESLSLFLDLLYSIEMQDFGEDKLCWRPSIYCFPRVLKSELIIEH